MKLFYKNIYLLLPLIVFVVLAAFLWRGLHRDPHLLPSPFLNKTLAIFPAPSFIDHSKPITLSDFQGKVTLLNVFATWCLSCHTEHPILMDIARSGIVNVVGLDYKDNHAAVADWLQKYGNPYHQIIDDVNGSVAINLGVYGTPETFIIDRQGVVRAKYTGPLTTQVWRNVLLPEINHWQQT